MSNGRDALSRSHGTVRGTKDNTVTNTRAGVGSVIIGVRIGTVTARLLTVQGSLSLHAEVSSRGQARRRGHLTSSQALRRQSRRKQSSHRDKGECETDHSQGTPTQIQGSGSRHQQGAG